MRDRDTDYSMGENDDCHLGTSLKIYTTCKDTNYGYKSLNIRSSFCKLFSLFIQYLAWLQTLKYTFIYKSIYFLKIFAVAQHFSYSCVNIIVLSVPKVNYFCQSNITQTRGHVSRFTI